MKNKTLKNSKWLKVSQLKVGQRIAVPKEEVFDRSSPEIDYPVADIAESVERQGTMPKAEGVKGNRNFGTGTTKKAPIESASESLASSIGAACRTVCPGLPTDLSISDLKVESSRVSVEIPGAVEGTGFAPVGSWLIIPNRYCTPPAANIL